MRAFPVADRDVGSNGAGHEQHSRERGEFVDAARSDTRLQDFDQLEEDCVTPTMASSRRQNARTTPWRRLFSALMIGANELDPDRHGHIREQMVDLITITESFYACGVASSVYCTKDPAGSVVPDAVFSNIGKLLLATKIYGMHKIAHYVSGGLIVALPAPDEDHNPETKASLTGVIGGRSDIPMEQRMDVARFIEDLTVSNKGGWYSVISLHGGGSPEAMKREIWRNYPVMEKIELVESLLDRGILANDRRVSKQPGRCCATGCAVPKPPAETHAP
jgi:4-hydroxybutyryl-CoA dehydratase / vinylacetyl-CoA-Delta-isomerase